jgi:hypothetical protein
VTITRACINDVTAFKEGVKEYVTSGYKPKKCNNSGGGEDKKSTEK